MTEAKQAAGSQTLSRGLTALEVLAESDAPLSIGELASRLGLHRSIAYRIVRTLEDHGLVVRGANGELELGARLAALARNVSRSAVRRAARADRAGERTRHDGVPRDARRRGFRRHTGERRTAAGDRGGGAAAGQPAPDHRRRTGSRDPAAAAREQAAYETSHDEVIPGLSSIAVPLAVPGQHPAALAVVYLTGPADISAIGERLALAARVIRDELHP